MPDYDTNPYAVSFCMASRPRNILRLFWTSSCSSLVFVFSFLSLGSLFRTFSFSFALSYTLEMIAEHLFLCVQIFGCYTLLNFLFLLVQNKPKSVFWPLISGAVSFLILNDIWSCTGRLVSLLSEPFRSNIDNARMWFLPPIEGIVLEAFAIVLMRWSLNRFGNRNSSELSGIQRR